jgi:hypothetical protein
LGRQSNSAALAGAMAINAYVVGTLVIVFPGIALYRMGHSGIATYHGTRKRHQLGSWALVLRKKWGAAAVGRLPLDRRRGPGGFGRISPVKSASCLALAHSHTAYKPPTNERHADEERRTRSTLPIKTVGA